MRIGYYKFDRVFWLLFIIFGVAVLILPSIQKWRANDPGPVVFYYVGILCFLLFFIWKFINSFNYILVFLEGILVVKPFRKKVFFLWSEIRSVRGGLWSRGIHLANEEVTKKVHLDPNYENFRILLELLRIFRPDLWQIDTQLTFFKSPVLMLLFLSMGLIFTGWGGYEIIVKKDNIGIFLLFASLGGYLFLFALPWKLTLQGKGLVLNYLFHKRVIFANEVGSIVTNPHPTLPLMNSANLRLTLRNKKVIELSWFNVGASILYIFLMSWWGKANIPKLHQGWLLLDKPVKIPSIGQSEYKQLARGS